MSLEVLISSVMKYNQDLADITMIRKAYQMADKFHAGQKRKSGEPYIIHPLAVAGILAELEADANTIVGALLHDTLEDTALTKDELAREFSPYIAMLVDGVTKIDKMNFSSTDEEVASNTRKLLCGIIEDIRIILIKLADRLHNMRTLQFKSPEKQVKISSETMDTFVPIANLLGLQTIKNELEDLCLKFLDPEMYYQLDKKVTKIEADVNDDLYLMLSKIHALLVDNGIPNEIKIRVKSVYGIYKKMQRGNKLNEIHDLLSLKITVDEIMQCYMTFGLIHSVYHPVPEKFKDFIYNPKTNLYRGLHTTVFGEGDRLVQNQIRTPEMARTASLGVAAYWQDPNVVMNDVLRSRLQFFDPLVAINQSANDDQRFLADVRQEILGDKIYVYTPRGDIIQLPAGATAVDFAYKIHTEIGQTITSAIVNGRLVPKNTVLHNHDIVRILTHELEFGPDEDCASQCKTATARNLVLALCAKNAS